MVDDEDLSEPLLSSHDNNNNNNNKNNDENCIDGNDVGAQNDPEGLGISTVATARTTNEEPAAGGRGGGGNNEDGVILVLDDNVLDPWKNYNVLLSYGLCIFAGIADSIWMSVILSGFLLALANEMGDESIGNTLVGLAEGIQGLTMLVTALPVGIAADIYGKSKIVKMGAFITFITILITLGGLLNIRHKEYIYHHQQEEEEEEEEDSDDNNDNDDDGHHHHVAGAAINESSYIILIVALALWGIVGGIVNGPSQALFADSIQKGKRSELLTYLYSCYLVSSATGPIVGICLILTLGSNAENWSIQQMFPVFFIGIILEFPVAILMFFYDDKYVIPDDYDHNAALNAAAAAATNAAAANATAANATAANATSTTSACESNGTTENESAEIVTAEPTAPGGADNSTNDTAIVNEETTTTTTTTITATATDEAEAGAANETASTMAASSSSSSGGASENDHCISGDSNAGGNATASSTGFSSSTAGSILFLSVKSKDAIPYVLFMSSLVISLGSGASVKYFPLFFKECGLGSAAVQFIFLLAPLSISGLSFVAQRISLVYGRIETAVSFYIIGISLLYYMTYLSYYNNAESNMIPNNDDDDNINATATDSNIVRATSFSYFPFFTEEIYEIDEQTRSTTSSTGTGSSTLWEDHPYRVIIIIIIYLARTGIMNSVYPLLESVLMDNIVSNQRARWKSLESIAEFGWTGSALVGGILSDKHSYQFTFAITATLQLCGALLLILIRPFVENERVDNEGNNNNNNGGGDSTSNTTTTTSTTNNNNNNSDATIATTEDRRIENNNDED